MNSTLGVDGDGPFDLIIGAPLVDINGENSAASCVIPGLFSLS